MYLIYRTIIKLSNVIEIFILIRIILSFLNIRNENFFTDIVYVITEPILLPSRELIKKTGIDTGMFDFSPIVAVMLLRIIIGLVGRILL